MQQQLSAARDEKRQADSELKESEQRLSELANEAQNIEASLSPKKLIWEVVSFASQQPEVKEKADEAKRALDAELGKAAEQFNIPKAEATTPQVQSQLLELRDTGGRLRAIWLTLRRSKSGWLMLAILLAALVSVAAIVLMMRFTASSTKLLTGFLGALMSVVAFLSPYYGAAKRGLNFIEGALKRNEELKEEAKSTKRASLERVHDEKQKKAVAAQQTLKDKSDEIAQKEAQLLKLSADGRMATFIRQRSQSTDYTKHLGVISRARDDFEQLSILLEKEKHNRVEQTALLPRIDRIILYIDDLDRCPEDKVVDVLQAVHLLLAFPLFIVVVGVDSRWLLHSLREHLKVFQNESPDTEEMSKEERTHWQSTPLNYLEKIFQIPFTLRPMNPHGFGKMVDDLAGQKDGSEAGSNGKGEARPAGTKTEDAVLAAGTTPPAEASPVSQTSPASQPSGGSVTPVTTVAGPAATQTQPQTSTAGAVKPAGEKRMIDPNPQYLKIEKWERDFMKRLFEMIPSPRAAKRFINIYRLLRASVPDEERQYFIGNEKGGKHRAALLLLAILTGYPAQATEILRALLEEEHSEPWWTLIERFRERAEPRAASGGDNNQNGQGQGEADDAEIKRWGELMRALDKIREEKTADLGPLFVSNQPCGDFVELAPQVARYSFQSGRVLLERRATNNAE